MVVGPIAMAYNLSGVSNLVLKPATIAKIFAGKITTWNDPEIAGENVAAIHLSPMRRTVEIDNDGVVRIIRGNGDRRAR